MINKTDNRSKILETSENEFIDFVVGEVDKAEKVTIITGYYTDDALALLLEKIKNKKCCIDIYIGKLFDNQVIKLPASKNVNIHLVKYLEQFVHAKLYVFETAEKQLITIGSSNFTVSGLVNNFEVNAVLESNDEDKSKILKFMILIKKFSVSLNTKEAKQFMENPFKARIVGELKYLYEDEDTITQARIKELEKYIKRSQVLLLDYIEDVKSGRLTALEFKEKYLMEEVWTIANAKHTDLWSRIKTSPPNQLYKAMEQMFSSAAKLKDPDEIIETGRIPNLFGIGVLSELLHRRFYDRFPIKNKTSGWGLCLVYNMSPENVIDSMAYSKFIEYCDKVYLIYKEWMNEKKITLKDEFKYYYLDAMFEALYSSEKYEEVIREFYRGKKDNAY